MSMSRSLGPLPNADHTESLIQEPLICAEPPSSAKESRSDGSPCGPRGHSTPTRQASEIVRIAKAERLSTGTACAMPSQTSASPTTAPPAAEGRSCSEKLGAHMTKPGVGSTGARLYELHA